MKTSGIILVILGFLGASLFSVLQIDGVSWLPYAAMIGIGAVGLVLVKRSHHAGARDEHHVHGNLETLGSSLANINRELEALTAGRDDIPPHEFRFEIDRRFREDLTAFAEARESMQHAFGLQAYADIMSAFAAGERYINRVWTASADGYIDEVLAYLEKARRQFTEAAEAFEAQRTRTA